MFTSLCCLHPSDFCTLNIIAEQKMEAAGKIIELQLEDFPCLRTQRRICQAIFHSFSIHNSNKNPRGKLVNPIINHPIHKITISMDREHHLPMVGLWLWTASGHRSAYWSSWKQKERMGQDLEVQKGSCFCVYVYIYIYIYM